MAFFDQSAFMAALAQKYRIMQQQADADTTRASAGLITAQSGADFDKARTYGMGRLTDANIAQTQAQTAGINQTNQFIAPLAQSQIGLQRSQARQNTAQAGYLDSETTGNSILDKLRSLNLFGQGL